MKLQRRIQSLEREMRVTAGGPSPTEGRDNARLLMQDPKGRELAGKCRGAFFGEYVDPKVFHALTQRLRELRQAAGLGPPTGYG